MELQLYQKQTYLRGVMKQRRIKGNFDGFKNKELSLKNYKEHLTKEDIHLIKN